MKLYYPIAVLCSIIGCAIFLPFAASTWETNPFEGLLAAPYAIATGWPLAYMSRRIWEKVNFQAAMFLAIPLGFIHVSAFGGLYGMVQRGVEGLGTGWILAIWWTLKVIYVFIPLCIGAGALIKWSCDKEVEDLEFGD